MSSTDARAQLFESMDGYDVFRAQQSVVSIDDGFRDGQVVGRANST